MEHQIQVNDKIRELFRQHKVFVQDNQQFDGFRGGLHFDDELQIEPYTEIIGTNGELWSIGNSTYMNSTYFPVSTRVGRFCSIAPGVRSMPNDHATNRFTSSTISGFDKETLRGGSFTHYGSVALSIEPDKNNGFQPVTIEASSERPIVIGNDVWIGINVWIKPGVHIGNGAVVGMGSIVTHDVPAYAVVAGSPAIVRKMRFSDSIIEQLEQLAWWQYPYWDLQGIRGDMPIEAFIDQVEKLVAEGKLQPYEPEPLTARLLLNPVN